MKIPAIKKESLNFTSHFSDILRSGETELKLLFPNQIWGDILAFVFNMSILIGYSIKSDLRWSIEFVNFSQLINIILSSKYCKFAVITVVFLKRNLQQKITIKATIRWKFTKFAPIGIFFFDIICNCKYVVGIESIIVHFIWCVWHSVQSTAVKTKICSWYLYYVDDAVHTKYQNVHTPTNTPTMSV